MICVLINSIYALDLRVSRPNESRRKDRDLLIRRDVLSWLLEVAYVGDCNHPLEGGGPEED